MSYIVYKNINEGEFLTYKLKLNMIENKIIKRFPNLLPQKRKDDADFLAISFEVKDSPPLYGSFAIVFEDLPSRFSFQVGVIKTFDKDEYRYFKRELIEHKGLEFIERNFVSIIESLLKRYYSWTKEDVINAEKVKLSE